MSSWSGLITGGKDTFPHTPYIFAGPSAGKKNPNVELMAREDMTMSDFVWKIQQQEKELVRKERAAKVCLGCLALLIYKCFEL